MQAETGDALDRPLPPLGFTPLAIAAIRGHSDIVTDLLARGADPNAIFFGSLTALSSAARTCTVPREVVALLIDAGAELDAVSGAGLTPAMAAVASGRADVAHLLLDRGADPHAVTAFGDGLLSFADAFGAETLARGSRPSASTPLSGAAWNETSATIASSSMLRAARSHARPARCEAVDSQWRCA